VKKSLIALLIFLSLLNLSCTVSSTALQPDEPPFPAPTVILYAADWCWWCDEAEKFLKDNDVRYIERDLEDPEDFKKLQKIAKKLNYKGSLNVVPIFVVGRYIIKGLDPIEVMYALEKSKWFQPRWDSIL
jgi:glutaredoxin